LNFWKHKVKLCLIIEQLQVQLEVLGAAFQERV